MSSLICLPANEAGSVVVWQCAAVVNIKNNGINSTGARTIKSRPFRKQERDQEIFFHAQSWSRAASGHRR
jgi:hypothetical protein